MPATVDAAGDRAGRARETARALAAATGVAGHDVLVVLGSGWAGAAQALGEPVAEVDYADLPHLLRPVAPGHPGVARSYRLGGQRVLAMLGRTHLFEGHGPGPVARVIACGTSLDTDEETSDGG